MSAIQNLDVTLQDLVSKIFKGEFHIPKFQRDFVWKSGDIESLGDSIIRGYPISSMLVMPINGTLQIGSSVLKNNEVQVQYNKGEYVLDGQQRITSIARIFLGFDPNKEYYFDLLSILVDRFPEDNILEDSWIKSRIVSQSNYNYSKISSTFCKSFSTTINGDEKNTRQYNRFISGRAIIENRYAAVINRFLRKFEDKKEEEIDKYTDYLNALLGSVGGYGIPITLISGDSDLSLVIRVFEKVNSTGKNLSLFDLINAKTFKKNSNSTDNEGLAEFLTNEIRKFCEQSKSSKAIEQYFEYSSNLMQYKNLARVIRIISILELFLKNNHPHITKSIMFNKDGSFWFSMWKSYGIEILKTIEWLNQYHLIELGNSTFIEYIIPLIIKFPAIKNQAIFIENLKKYILYTNIKKIGFSKTNLDIIMKFHNFSEKIHNLNNLLQKHNVSLSLNMDLTLDADYIKSIMCGKSATYYSSLYILYNERPTGMGYIDLTNNKIIGFKNNTLDEHHLVPKSKKNTNSIVNSIANISLLNINTNRYEIKEVGFYSYLNELKKIYSKEQFENILRQNYLNVNLINEEVSELEILEDRAKIFAEIITNYFKQS
ncbi:DUF262 domain-containing protein [Sulfurospirillum sp. 1307]